MISCGCCLDEACSGGKCGCFSGQLSYTEFCNCQTCNTEACHNHWTKTAGTTNDDGDEEEEEEEDGEND